MEYEKNPLLEMSQDQIDAVLQSDQAKALLQESDRNLFVDPNLVSQPPLVPSFIDNSNYSSVCTVDDGDLSNTLESIENFSDLEQLDLDQSTVPELFPVENENDNLEVGIYHNDLDDPLSETDIIFKDHSYSMHPVDCNRVQKSKVEQQSLHEETLDDQIVNSADSIMPPRRRSQRQLEKFEREQLEKIKAENAELQKQEHEEIQKTKIEPIKEKCTEVISDTRADVEILDEENSEKSVVNNSPQESCKVSADVLDKKAKRKGGRSKYKRHFSESDQHSEDTGEPKTRKARQKKSCSVDASEKSHEENTSDNIKDDVEAIKQSLLDLPEVTETKYPEVKNSFKRKKSSSFSSSSETPIDAGKKIKDKSKSKHKKSEKSKQSLKDPKETLNKDSNIEKQTNSENKPVLTADEVEAQNKKESVGSIKKSKEKAKGVIKERRGSHVRRDSHSASVDLLEPALFSQPDVMVKIKEAPGDRPKRETEEPYLSDSLKCDEDLSTQVKICESSLKKNHEQETVKETLTNNISSFTPKHQGFADSSELKKEFNLDVKTELSVPDENEAEILKRTLDSSLNKEVKELVSHESSNENQFSIMTAIIEKGNLDEFNFKPKSEELADAETGHSDKSFGDSIEEIEKEIKRTALEADKKSNDSHLKTKQNHKSLDENLKNSKIKCADKSAKVPEVCGDSPDKETRTLRKHKKSQKDEVRKSSRKHRKTRKSKGHEGSSKSQKKSNEDSSSDDIDYSDDPDDSDWSSEDDPEKLWCICRKPHDDRFMIQCDKCQDWFHGTCVGVTKQQGRQLEKEQKEWKCPHCIKGSETNQKQVQKISSNSSKSALKSPTSKTQPKLTIPKTPMKSPTSKTPLKSPLPETPLKSPAFKVETKSIPTKTEVKSPTIKIEGKFSTSRKDASVHVSKPEVKAIKPDLKLPALKTDIKSIVPKPDVKSPVIKSPLDKTSSTGKDLVKVKKAFSPPQKEIPVKDKKQNVQDSKKKSSSVPPVVKLKFSKDTPQAGQCVVCRKPSPKSLYCDLSCIEYQVELILNLLEKDGSKLGEESSSLPVQKVVLLEKQTGKLIIGSDSPTKESLLSWMKEHPTYELHLTKITHDTRKEPGTQKPSKEPVRKLSHSEANKDQIKKPQQLEGSKEQTKKPVQPDSSKDQIKKPAQVTVKKETNTNANSNISSSTTSTSSSSSTTNIEPVRINVRKALLDALSSRCKEVNDIEMSEEEIKKLVKLIEEELFKVFKDVNSKYKAKYRSLVFNIKDSRNEGLFRKILSSRISPNRLVKMSPEELASSELAKWRERENKHALDIIKRDQFEQQQQAATSHVIKKTHKGEVEIEEEEDLKLMEVAEKINLKPQEEEHPADSTNLHRGHLFDLNCKICTGKMAPPTDEPPIKKPRVSHSIITPSFLKDYEEADRICGITTSQEPKKQTEASHEDQEPTSTVVLGSPDTTTPHQPRTDKGPGSIWKGFIAMQDIAKFVTSAYKVSGQTDFLAQDIPDTIQVCGRIIPDQVWDYLGKIKQSGNKELLIMRFQPANDEEKEAYLSFYTYLNSRKRYGVVGNTSKMIKDFYILPLASHSPVPTVLMPFDGPGLDAVRSHLLLGVIVRHKLRPLLMAELTQMDSKTLFEESPEEEQERSYTPPLEDMPTPVHLHNISDVYNPAKELRSASLKSSAQAMSLPLPVVKEEDSKGVTPIEDEDEPYEPSYTPPLEMNPNIETIASPDEVEMTLEEEEYDDDEPYDPEESEINLQTLREQNKSKKTTIPSLLSEFTSDRVNELIEEISKSSDPAEFASTVLSSIGTTLTLEQQRQLLVELTEKVEEQKHHIEQQRLEALSAHGDLHMYSLSDSKSGDAGNSPHSPTSFLPGFGDTSSDQSTLDEEISAFQKCGLPDSLQTLMDSVRKKHPNSSFEPEQKQGKNVLEDPIVKHFAEVGQEGAKTEEEKDVSYSPKMPNTNMMQDFETTQNSDLSSTVSNVKAQDPRIREDPRLRGKTGQDSAKTSLSSMSASELIERAQKQLAEMEALENTQKSQEDSSSSNIMDSLEGKPWMTGNEPPPPGIDADIIYPTNQPALQFTVPPPGISDSTYMQSGTSFLNHPPPPLPPLHSPSPSGMYPAQLPPPLPPGCEQWNQQSWPSTDQQQPQQQLPERMEWSSNHPQWNRNRWHSQKGSNWGRFRTSQWSHRSDWKGYQRRDSKHSWNRFDARRKDRGWHHQYN